MIYEQPLEKSLRYANHRLWYFRFVSRSWRHTGRLPVTESRFRRYQSSSSSSSSRLDSAWSVTSAPNQLIMRLLRATPSTPERMQRLLMNFRLICFSRNYKSDGRVLAVWTGEPAIYQSRAEAYPWDARFVMQAVSLCLFLLLHVLRRRCC